MIYLGHYDRLFHGVPSWFWGFYTIEILLFLNFFRAKITIEIKLKLFDCFIIIYDDR